MPPTSVQVPPRKRRKTQLACNPCRARKSGCDGARPACTSCRSKGWDQRCEYQNSVSHASSRPWGIPRRLDIQQRLERLEGSPVARPSADHASVGAPMTMTMPQGAAAGTVSDHDAAESRHVVGRKPARPTDEGRALTDRPSPVISSRNNDEPVYGPSSNASFLRQVTLVANPDVSDQPSPSAAGDSIHGNTPTVLGFSIAQPENSEPPPEPITLPERWFADGLMETFWTLVHNVFPILHKPSFMAFYDALWEPAPGRRPGRARDFERVVFHATLNMVLALGSQRTDQGSAARQAHATERFYHKSLRLVSMDTLNHSSLSVVQLLLLMGVFLHYTPYADRCWNTIGVALRVAQSIGLHAEQPRTAAADQLRREIRRRVWHCCLTLDCLTATTFGRPVSLARQHRVPEPAAIDDEYLSADLEAVQPPGRPSYLSFFVHSLALFDVLHEVLGSFYVDGSLAAGQGAEDLSHLLRLSSRLDDLSEQFPYFLKENGGVDLTRYDGVLQDCLRMQTNVLKSRVLWIRLLLQHPFLLAEARDVARSKRTPPEPPSLRDRLRHAANEACITTAHEVLQEMHERLGSAHQNSPWHVLLFTFAAASTLVVATFCPRLHASLDSEPTKGSWDRAMRIFEFHRDHVTSARNGIEVLQRFRDLAVGISARADATGSYLEPRRGKDTLPNTFDPDLDQNYSPSAQNFDAILDFDFLQESCFNPPGIEFNDWFTVR